MYYETFKIKPKNIAKAYKTAEKLAKDPKVKKAIETSIDLIKKYQKAQEKAKMETIKFQKVFKQTQDVVKKAEKLSKDPKVKKAVKVAANLVKEYQKSKEQAKMETLGLKSMARKAKKAGQAAGHAVVHVAQNKKVQKVALNGGKLALKAGEYGVKYAANHPNQVAKLAMMAA